MFSLRSVCLFVCLSACPSDNWKSCERILTKFLGGVGHGPGTNEFNIGDDPHHRPDPGVRSPKSGFTAGLSIMLAFGGSLCFLSISSVSCVSSTKYSAVFCSTTFQRWQVYRAAIFRFKATLTNHQMDRLHLCTDPFVRPTCRTKWR